MLKESRFLVAHKTKVGYELNPPTSELVLYARMLVEEEDTLEELEANLKELGYNFKHKESGERTEEVNAVIMKLDKNYSHCGDARRPGSSLSKARLLVPA